MQRPPSKEVSVLCFLSADKQSTPLTPELWADLANITTRCTYESASISTGRVSSHLTNPYSKETLESLFNIPETLLLVAIQSERPIGFCLLHLEKFPGWNEFLQQDFAAAGPFGYGHLIAIDTAWQGQGLYRRMAEAAAPYLEQVQGLLALVRVDNHGALAAHRQIGWQSVGIATTVHIQNNPVKFALLLHDIGRNNAATTIQRLKELSALSSRYFQN